MRSPKLSVPEVAFVKDRVKSSQGLALALSITADTLHRGMEQTELLLGDYEKRIAQHADLINKVSTALFRLDDRAQSEPKKAILSEIEAIRSWLGRHWQDGRLQLPENEFHQ